MQLTKKDISKILSLKEEHWKYGKQSQLKHFKKNYKKNDINNCIFKGKNLIGYTALKNRRYFYKKKEYFLFDALIIKKKFQKKKLSRLLMEFNNLIINFYEKPSFLLCEKKMVNFYKLFGWKRARNVVVKDSLTNKLVMSFNFKNKLKNKDKIEIYLNR